MQQFVEQELCGTGLDRLAVGVPDLSEDLVFADDLRIQGGGDTEQVPDGVQPVVAVEDRGVGGQRRLFELPDVTEQVTQRIRNIPGNEVDLGPVARVEDKRFLEDILLTQAAQKPTGKVARQRELLADGHRSRTVVQADYRESSHLSHPANRQESASLAIIRPITTANPAMATHDTRAKFHLPRDLPKTATA